MSDYEAIKGEIWKVIPGYQDKYAVSNFGRVKRLERDIPYTDRRNGKLCIMHLDEMLFVLNRSKSKVTVSLRDNSTGEPKQCSEYVHRLVAEAFVDNPNHLNRVKHKDGNILNNKASNLMWV